MTCTGACLICDAIEVSVDSTGKPAISHACPACEKDILESLEREQQGTDTHEDVYRQAQEILGTANMPLICGLADQSLETQQAAVHLARSTNAVIDWTTGNSHSAIHAAFQETGLVSCTFQEINERADLVVYWPGIIETSHTAFVRRFVAGKKQFSVDWNRNRQIAALRLLRATSNHTENLEIDAIGDEEFVAEVIRFKRLLDQSSYPVILIDETLAPELGDAGVLSLFRFVRDQNDRNHCRLVQLSHHGNSAGIESTMTSLTGAPAGVTFRDGQPFFRSCEFTVERLLRNGWVDVMVLVGSPDQLHGVSVGDNVRKIHICDAGPTGFADVVIHTSRWGLGCDGTGIRDDGLPVERKAIFPGCLPDPASVLARLSG